MSLVTVEFARAAQALSTATRAAGLAVPTFCSPPRRADAVRTIRRRSDGHAVIAVRLRGRELADIHADMVEGICVANGLRGGARERLRSVLLGVLPASGHTDPPGPPVSSAPADSAVASRDNARMAERHTQAA